MDAGAEYGGPRPRGQDPFRASPDIEVTVETPGQFEGLSAVASPAPRRGMDAPAPSWREYLGTAGLSKLLVLAGLLGWMYSDHLYRLYRWWLQPDWSHGFLIPLFSLYVVHLKRRELMADAGRGSVWGFVLMAMSTVVYIAAVYMKVGYPQPLSIVSMIAGMVLFLRGWRTLWLTLFPIAFLILAMPPPERMYRALTQPLQQFAALLSTAALNLFPGAEVERSGVNISYWVEGHGSGTFTVAGACSGMRSLMAFVAMGLAMAYFSPRPMWHRIATAAIVVPVALFCNVLRVIATGCLQMYGHESLSMGTAHTTLGLATFGLGFVLFMIWLWVLDHLVVEESPGNEAASATGART
jgi:exosortase